MLPFDFAALPPEVNVGRLLAGAGATPILETAVSYAKLAADLTSAAAATTGMAADMTGSWQGMSAEQARAAFGKHATWLQEQAAIATGASAAAADAGAAFLGARSLMELVAAQLAENRAEQTVLLGAAPTPVGMGLLAANEMHYLAIWAEAAGVMAGYAGAAVPALESLPQPLTPPPIVSGPVPPPTDYKLPPSPTGWQGTNTTHANPGGGGGDSHPGGGSGSSGDHAGGDHPGGDQPSGGSQDPTGPGDGPQGSDPSGPGLEDGLTDPVSPDDPLSSMPDYYGGEDGYGADDSWSGQDNGFYGTSPESSTLTGRTAGVGSAGVALSMARGGMSSMAGAATGFRMPGNWNPASTRAFGATPAGQPTSAAPPRKGPPRGATAPAARMRRRKDEERKSKSTVFVPGEPMEVPVLDKAPVIGVIEYAGEYVDEVAPESRPAVGVIEHVEEDVAVLAASDRPR